MRIEESQVNVSGDKTVKQDQKVQESGGFHEVRIGKWRS